VIGILSCAFEYSATLEAAATPFVAWLSVAPKAAGFIVVFRLYLEGAGSTGLVWVPVVSAMAGLTIVAGNLMAIPQSNVKRMLAYSGVAHIGYMLKYSFHFPRSSCARSITSRSSSRSSAAPSPPLRVSRTGSSQNLAR
jgi:NADH:ubiquinone oxidoreductase subunit 4 (subunit M)